jgi:HK97 family phage major capsid protein
MPAPLKTRHQIDLAKPEFREMRREFSVNRAAIDKEKRTVELSFASDEPVERWFGREILDISKDACDLSRLNNGGALLVNHDWDDQVGVCLESSIDPATKKARTVAKFSRSVRGEEIFQDIVDGIRSLVSVGYIVRKMVLQSVDGDVETHRVTDWQPYEVSIVAVPADTSVGVGRSAARDTNQKPNQSIPMNRSEIIAVLNKRGIKFEESATDEALLRLLVNHEPAATSGARTEARPVDHLARQKDIRESAKVLATRHPQHAEAINALRDKVCFDTGDDVGAFQRTVLNDILGTNPSAPGAVRQVSSELGLNRKEQARYSLFRALRLKGENRPLDGLEREASEAEAKRLGRDAEGFFVPAEIFSFARNHVSQMDATRRELIGAMLGRDLSAGVPNSGGYLIGETIDNANMVELLRNQSHLLALGARTLTGLVGNVTIPRVLTGSTVYWVNENGQITGSTPTFGQIAMKPRRIGATGILGKQLIAQTSMDVEAFYRQTVMEDMGVELDRVGINGKGGAEPLGILNLATADRATSVTFGGAATWAKIVEFETSVETANALGLAGGEYAYLTTPAARGKWKTIPKATNAAVFLWEGSLVNGYQARSTNQFPSSPTANQAIFGQFSQVIYGEWAGLDVVVDNITLADKHQIKVTVQKLIDMVIRQGKAFAISSDTAAA